MAAQTAPGCSTSLREAPSGRRPITSGPAKKPQCTSRTEAAAPSAWRGALVASQLADEFDMARGHEFASYIIEAKEKDHPAVIYGSVANQGSLIENLPLGGVVEVACLVDAKGVQPVHFGRLPSHLAVFNQQHMAFHDCVVRSVLGQDREAAVHALMIDPLTAAVCSLREIRGMFDELAEAERDYLPEYLAAS